MKRVLIMKNFLFLICVMSFACSSVSAQKQGFMTVSGIVSVKGNEPFIYCALTSSGRAYSIVGKRKTEIMEKYQNREITVTGTIVREGEGSLPYEIDVDEIVKIR
jgi:hypothetical protein